MRADRAAAGTAPVRCYRYCEAFTSAAAFGWYLFPPIDFALQWDGTDVLWTYPEAGDEWYPTKSGASLPGLAEHLLLNAPDDVGASMPPFLSGFPESGVVQVWTGYFARTRADWGLLIRAPVNFNNNHKLQHFEGFVHYDLWPGSVFINIRLLQTDHPIEFQKAMPILQVQPVHRSLLSDDFLNNFSTEEPDWGMYKEILNAADNPKRRKGAYAACVRKRQPAALLDPFG